MLKRNLKLTQNIFRYYYKDIVMLSMKSIQIVKIVFIIACIIGEILLMYFSQEMT